MDLACWAPPEGRARCSLRLLQRGHAELETVDGIGRETVRRTLRKRCETAAGGVPVHTAEGQRRIRLRDGGCSGNRSPGVRRGWGGLPRRDFEAADDGDPAPGARQAGKPAGEDFEYERSGVARLFMVFAPLLGCCVMEITDLCPRID